MISFIILHYKNITETIECLTSLKGISKKDDHFIIVDNNTLSSSEEKLIRKFSDDIIKLDKNYGFAKANNKGIRYARKKYNSKYFVVMNNDVLISQSDFNQIVDMDYIKYNFDMLGPYIDSPSGESVNPFPVIKNVEAEIKKCKKLIGIYSRPLLYFVFESLLNIKHVFFKPVILTNGKNVKNNVSLHGCCIVFSKKYIDKYQDAFYNETFLFHEEEFLYKRVIKDSLISIYDPKLKVYHKEGSSIKISNKNKRLSKLFREKERIKSLNMLK